jgi:hypothetical protein
MDDLDLDLTMLEESSTFDLNHFGERPEDLFSFTAILICNDEPDIQCMEYFSDTELAMFIQSEFDSDAIQTIVKNNHEDSKALCPYFRIVMEKYSVEAPINFKLHSMFIKMGIQSISPRCVKALVAGLTSFTHLESPINVPYCFMSTNLDPLDFVLEREELDLVCLKPCAEKLNPESTDLCDIAGMTLPYRLPWEVQVNILRYLRHPVADMVLHKIDSLCLLWDLFLHPMFVQREPRIPFHIASFFNASTVLSTAAGATSPFLAMSAPRIVPSALPNWVASL